MKKYLLVAAAIVAVIGAKMLLDRGLHHRSAGQNVAADMALITANLPPGDALSYGAVETNALTGVTTVHDVVFSRAGEKRLAADLVTFAGVDAGALRDILDVAAYKDGKPAWTARRVLIADLTVSGLHVVKGPPGSGVRSITLRGFAGRPFMMPPTPANREKPAFQADAALAFAVQDFELQDVTGTAAPEPGGGQTQGQTKGSLAAFVVKGYDGGKLAEASFKGFVVDGFDKKHQPVHVALDMGAVKNIDAAAVLAGIVQTGHAPQTALNGIEASSAMMAGLRVTIGGGPEISLHHALVSQTSSGQDTKTGVGSIHDFKMALGQTPMSPQGSALRTAFGMDSLTMDWTGHSTAHPAAGDTQFEEDIVFQDLGTLHMSAQLSDVRKPTDPAPAAAMAMLMQMKINQASLAWDDASLTGRLLALAAAQQHVTVDMIRTQFTMPLVTLGVLMPEQPDAGEQVIAFLNHPHHLKIEARPGTPVSLADLARAPATQRAPMLNLHVSGD